MKKIDSMTNECGISIPGIEPAVGADPHCFRCEGYGVDFNFPGQSKPCPVCMEDLYILGVDPAKGRPPEKYSPRYEDRDHDALLDGVEFLEAKYYRGVLLADAVHSIVMHQGVSAASIAKYFHLAPDGRVVSAHFEVRDDGEIVQCVPLTRIAFHAPPFNRVSYGIELQGPWGKVWPDKQIESCVELCESLIALRPHIRFIRAHSAISKHRRDPGSPKHPFPWERFRDLGVQLVTKRAA